jgi:inhibitor of cysteine peptidase
MFAKLQTTLVLMIALGIVVSAAGCNPKTVSLGADADGSQVELAVGERLVVRLDGNPSTGYTWEVQEGAGTVLAQIGEAEFEGSDPALDGSGGTLTLTFEAARAGTTTLVLVYHRPWEADVEPVDTFTVTVTVR